MGNCAIICVEHARELEKTISIYIYIYVCMHACICICICICIYIYIYIHIEQIVSEVAFKTSASMSLESICMLEAASKAFAFSSGVISGGVS